MATYDVKKFRSFMIGYLQETISDGTPFVFKTQLRDEMFAKVEGTEYELDNECISKEHWIVSELFGSIQNICGSVYSGGDGIYFTVNKYDTNIGYNISVHIYDDEDTQLEACFIFNKSWGHLLTVFDESYLSNTEMLSLLDDSLEFIAKYGVYFECVYEFLSVYYNLKCLTFSKNDISTFKWFRKSKEDMMEDEEGVEEFKSDFAEYTRVYSNYFKEYDIDRIMAGVVKFFAGVTALRNGSERDVWDGTLFEWVRLDTVSKLKALSANER